MTTYTLSEEDRRKLMTALQNSAPHDPWLRPRHEAAIVFLAMLPKVQDAGVPLTQDEIAFVMNELRPDHDGSDFEPECPTCTAFKKLAAAAMKDHPAPQGQGEAK